MTYDGWERDVRSMEREWLRGSEVDIQREVAKMRRWQCLHDGDRTDAALQVLDAVKQGLTYEGWEKDVEAVEWTWARTGGVSEFRVHPGRRGEDAPAAAAAHHRVFCGGLGYTPRGTPSFTEGGHRPML